MDSPIKNFVCSPYLWLFFIIMGGLWLFCWAAWGGELKFTVNGPANEAGMGLNPPVRT